MTGIVDNRKGKPKELVKNFSCKNKVKNIK